MLLEPGQRGRRLAATFRTRAGQRGDPVLDWTPGRPHRTAPACTGCHGRLRLSAASRCPE